jgi:L-amino acid N-acyltransferase YncA
MHQNSVPGAYLKEIDIRPIEEADFDAVWRIFQDILAAGDKYPFDDGSREACRAYWYGAGVKTWVAVLNGERLLGMYRVVPNQADRGAHVANASYMVSPAAQGIGVGKLLGRHSLEQARQDGYLAMQFNYVVSTNVAAVVLWKQLGFSVVGTLPKAYRHQKLGYVDVYVMYRLLDDPNNWPL